jgi:hypothetical protein
MNVLVLQHFSDYWEGELKNYGTNFETELNHVIDYIRNEKIDKVVIPLFEEDGLTNCHDLLIYVCNTEGVQIETMHYPYNWTKESDPDEEIYTKENFNKTWCQGKRSNHMDEDVVEIEDWQHNLKRANKVIVGGAFEDQCVLDLTTALEAIGVKYEREDSLIVGAYVDYDYRGLSPDKLKDKVSDVLLSIEAEVTEAVNAAGELFETDIFDLEDLHNYNPNFVMEVETRINELYEKYQEDLEIMDIQHNPHIGLIDCIIENTFEPQTESSQYQDIPDEYLENLLTIKLKSIEEEYENYFFAENIKDLALNNESEGEQFYSDLKDLYEELLEEFDHSEIIAVDVTSLTSSGITDQIWDDYVVEKKDLDLSTIAFLAQKELEKSIEGTYYHGTFWKFDKDEESEECSFVDLNMDYSVNGSVYISDSEETSDWFSDWKSNNEGEEMFIVLKYENIKINKLYNIPNGTKEININGIEYDVADDRENYFAELKNKYNGVIVVNNYVDHDGDDIAIFNENEINKCLTGIKIRNPKTKEWGEYIEPQKAVEIFKREYDKRFNKKLSKKNKASM